MELVGDPLPSPESLRTSPGHLGLRGRLRLTKSDSRCGARRPGGRRPLHTRMGTHQGARTARWRSRRAPQHRRNPARTWWAPAGGGSAAPGRGPQHSSQTPPCIHPALGLSLSKPAPPVGKVPEGLLCHCGAVVSPPHSPQAEGPHPARLVTPLPGNSPGDTELGLPSLGALWTSSHGPVGGSRCPLQEHPPQVARWGSPLGSTRPSLTQGVPVASIWHVGAQAAPNLFSEDWLQDWNVLGAEQVAAGKGAPVRRVGAAHRHPGPPSWPRYVPRSICGCPRQLSFPLMQ